MRGTHPIPEKCASAGVLSDAQNFLEELAPSYFQTDLAGIKLTSEGKAEVNGELLSVMQSFLESLADSIKMPFRYASHAGYELFVHNFRERSRAVNKSVTVCTVKGLAVNLVADDYQPPRTIDVLQGLGDLSEMLEFQSARVSEFGAELDYVGPKLVAEPSPGDIIRLGIRIGNSETGYRGLKASLFALRLVCLNGAVMADALGTAWWNYDYRVDYVTSVAKFCRDVKELAKRIPLQQAVYRQIAGQMISDADLLRLLRRFQGIARISPEQVDSMLGVVPRQRAEIRARIRGRSQGAPAQDTDFSVPMTKKTNWKQFTAEVLAVLAETGSKHYVKRDLQPYLPPGYNNPLRVNQFRPDLINPSSDSSGGDSNIHLDILPNEDDQDHEARDE